MVKEECLKKGTGGNKLTDLIITHLFIYEIKLNKNSCFGCSDVYGMHLTLPLPIREP